MVTTVETLRTAEVLPVQPHPASERRNEPPSIPIDRPVHPRLSLTVEPFVLLRHRP